MNFLSEDMRRNPYPVYAQLRKSSPLVHMPGADLWAVLDYEGVKRVLNDHEAFSSNVSPSRGLRFEWLLFMDPPRHTKLRAIVSRAFTPRSVAALEPRILQVAQDLLAGLGAQGEMDLCKEFAAPLPLLVIAAMLGMSGDEWPRINRWSQAIMNLGSTIIGTPDESRAASESFLAANSEMKEYLADLTLARRAAPQDDLLTRLVEAEVDGEHLVEEELLRFVQLLIAAGTETTTNLIDNAVLSLIEHPQELARLRAAPELLPSAIEEVLRYRSPAQAMFRATRRDVEMHGQRIPAGKMVLAFIGSANRDELQFVEPDRFDIGRSPNPHIAFGHGLHFCLGAPLSRLEARIGLEALLARWARFELASDVPWPPRLPFHVHGPARLPIRFTRF